MSRFSISFQGVQNVIDMQQNIEKMLADLREDAADVKSGLSFKVAARADIEKRLAQIDKSIEKIQKSKTSLRTALVDVSNKYRTTEVKLSGGKIVGEYAAAVMGTATAVADGVSELVHEAENRINSAVESFGSWTTKIKNELDEALGEKNTTLNSAIFGACMPLIGPVNPSKLRESIKESGFTHIIGRQGSNVYKIIKGAGETMSGAVGGNYFKIPYEMNNISSGIADYVYVDFYTRFMGKDIKDLDRLNVMKSFMGGTGELIGNLCGGEHINGEFGRALGEAIYHGGDLANSFISDNGGLKLDYSFSDCFGDGATIATNTVMDINEPFGGIVYKAECAQEAWEKLCDVTVEGFQEAWNGIE